MYLKSVSKFSISLNKGLSSLIFILLLKSKRKGHIFSFQLASIYPMTSNVVLNFRIYFLYKACRYKSLLDILLEDKSHKLQRCKIFTEAK